MAVASDSPEDRDKLVATLGLKYPLISDKDLTITRAFGVQQEECECSLPALYVIDAKNQVRLAKVGDNIVDRATSADVARALSEAAIPADAPSDATAAPASGDAKKKKSQKKKKGSP